jgi:hypothetical protein
MVFLILQSSLAQPPEFINYQGRLKQNGEPVNGNIDITFSIYEVESGGTTLWSEIQTVAVNAGIFNVQLGTATPFPTNLFTDPGERYLGVKVSAEPEMTTRFRFGLPQK